MKVDPRTGIITVGKRRPIAPPDTRRKQSNNNPPAPPVDMQTLLTLAAQIGKAIVAEMKDAPPSVIVQQVTARTGLPQDVVEVVVREAIEIDESVADVGLGEVDSLKKGEESAELVVEEVHSDTDLASAKDRLRALKKRG